MTFYYDGSTRECKEFCAELRRPDIGYKIRALRTAGGVLHLVTPKVRLGKDKEWRTAVLDVLALIGLHARSEHYRLIRIMAIAPLCQHD
jgi:hypothetical protein